MENCSRPNSGTVSHIMFKLGKRIEHPSGITRHDSKVKSSNLDVEFVHITRLQCRLTKVHKTSVLACVMRLRVCWLCTA